MRTKHKFDLRAVSPAASRATRGNARSPYARSFNRGPARATVGHLSLGSESIGASTTARNDVLVPVPCSPEIIAESPPSSLTSPWPAAAGLEHIRLAQEINIYVHDPGLMFVVKLAMTPLNVDLPDSVAKIVIHDLSNGTAKYAAAATNTNTSSDASIPTTDHQAATSLCLPPRRRQPLTTLCPGDYHPFYNPDPVQEDKENSPDGGVGYAGTCDGEEADDEADDEHDEESEIDMEMNVPLVRPPDFCPKPFRHKVYLILEGRKPGIYADLRDARRCQENLGIKFNSRVRHSLPEAQRLWQEAIIKQTIRVRNGESDCVCTVDGCHSDHYHDLWPDRGGNDYPRIFFGI